MQEAQEAFAPPDAQAKEEPPVTVITHKGLCVLVLRFAPWRLSWPPAQAIQIAMQLAGERARCIHRGSRIVWCQCPSDPAIRFCLTADQAGFLASELYQAAADLMKCPAGAVTVRIAE